MTKTLILKSKDTNFLCKNSGCEIFRYEQVRSCEFYNCERRFAVEIEKEQLQQDHTTTNTVSYVVCESPGSPAFSHWVLEFFIPNLCYLQSLNQEESLLLLLIIFTGHRYMINFLQYIGFKKENIIIATESNDHIYTMSNKKIAFQNINNIVYFPALHSHNDTSVSCQQWEDIFKISDNMKRLHPKINVDIPYLYLPRNSKDNYDQARNKQMSDEFEDWIIRENGVILDTYQLNNIDMQIDMIRNAKVIILYSGSSYIVNGFFAENSYIVVIDEIHIRGQAHIYPFYKAIHDYISRHNKVTILNHITDIFSYCFTH